MNAATKRYRQAPCGGRVNQIYKPPVQAAPVNTDSRNSKEETRRESVAEFVAYFYEFVRDDAAMVRMLDRALKERYGSCGTRS